MKINKLFGVKSITNLIYGILLFIPFASILSRVIYVQANPFAKDSYYGDTINEENTIEEDLPRINTITYVNSNPISTQNSGALNKIFNYVSAEIVGNSQYDLSRATYFRLYSNSTGNLEALFYSGTTQIYDIYLTRDNLLLKFVLGNIQDYQNGTISYDNKKIFYYIEYNNYSFLDNVFEYSIKSFTQENNLGTVNFFSWFTNMFLNQDNPTNAVYLGFTNWYLNYALLVSSGYLLFFALMWFINYVRKMLEKASYHDFGGF